MGNKSAGRKSPDDVGDEVGDEAGEEASGPRDAAQASRSCPRARSSGSGGRRFSVEIFLQGRELNVDVGKNTLQIGKIYEAGPVAAHNKRYPNQQIQVGDKFLELNGVKVLSFDQLADAIQKDTNMLRAVLERPPAKRPSCLWLLQARREPPSSGAQEEGRRWRISVDLAGKDLGADIERRTLKVGKIDEAGVLARFNTHNREIQVDTGDRILEVNGKRVQSLKEILTAFKKPGLVTMLLERPQKPPTMGVVLPDSPQNQPRSTPPPPTEPDAEDSMLLLSSAEGSGGVPDGGQGFDWVRQENTNNARWHRHEAHTKTRSACHHAGYSLDGRIVEFKGLADMREGTRFIAADSFRDLVLRPKEGKTEWLQHPPGAAIGVAADRSRAGRRVALVSAASAYHVGGGFTTGGRHALEEAMCVQTTLYESLLLAQEETKAKNGGRPVKRYLDGDVCVLSPHVEVFRLGSDKGYPFLPEAVGLSGVISVAMPNRNPRMRDAPVDAPEDPKEYEAVVSARFVAALTAAVLAGADTLVMPDIGCGVYGNDPSTVGRIFGEVVSQKFDCIFVEIHASGLDAFLSAAVAAATAPAENPNANAAVEVLETPPQRWKEGDDPPFSF